MYGQVLLKNREDRANGTCLTPHLNSPPNAQQEPRGVPPIPGLPKDSLQVTTQGSGFFITADGYAVTNRRVVENDRTAEIKTDDQKTYPAKVIGIDSVSDLALLKVEGRNDFLTCGLLTSRPALAIGY